MFTKHADIEVPGLRTNANYKQQNLIKSHSRYHSVNCLSEMLCFMQGFETNDKSKTKEPTKLLSVKNRLLRKSRSSSNFGSAGQYQQQQQQQPQQQQQRSAPATPQTTILTTTISQNSSSGSLIEPSQSQPCTPAAGAGCTSPSPSIQRSPSHSLFTKCDKASLKHLSTSTPAMTAQAQLPEPPSPKTTKETKEAKVPTMSKARQKKFNRHFPSVDDEKVLNYYSCALIGDILLQGHLYITKNYFAFYSNVFGYVTKLLIPMLSVEKITKEKTARIIPNAVGIATSEDKHVFCSLMSRDNAYRYMVKVWEVAQNASMLVVEPEIEPVPVSDSDSSETRDGESGRDSPLPVTNRLQTKDTDKVATTANNNNNTVHNIKKSSRYSLEITNVLKQNLSKLSHLPRQSLILYATTLLLILLFLSAAVLLYRISKIQNRFSFALHDKILINDNSDNNNNRKNINNNNNNNKKDDDNNNNKNNNNNDDDDIYNNLYQWQTHLHTKSAGAVHNFLDTNLDQIAKVRQSLEALSTLLTTNGQENERNEPNKQPETTNIRQNS